VKESLRETQVKVKRTKNRAKLIKIKYSLTQLAKTLCLLYYAYVFSSRKLEIRAEQVLPGSGGRGEK
jgi:hypothetical protein